MRDDIAIRVENLGKCYQIGQAKSGDLRQSFAHWWDGLRGRSNGQEKAAAEKEFWALKDLNFEIKRGEAVGIIGRNGAGKSTLLKILSRITEPTTGRFEINGRVSSLLEVGTGFHPELSGRENIYLNGTILGMKRREVKAKFDEIVAFSGIEKFIDTPVKHYSSGMKVRLAFSVAAHLEPEILIIDEVLAVGDSEFQKRCLGKMDEVSKGEGRTILFVSHDMAAVANLCSKAILLEYGVISKNGEPGTVINHYLKGHKLSHQVREIGNKAVVQITPSKLEVTAGDSIIFTIDINSEGHNQISGLAFLVTDELGKRVGIIDLRKHISPIQKYKKISLDIQVESLPLVEGVYFIGIYIDSTLVGGDFYEISSFTVNPIATGSLVPYHKRHRGVVDFSHKLLVQTNAE
jgi:lipopolysaccharide transport system ATP-binding protein